MQTFAIASFLALAGTVLAQTQYQIDPNTVSASDRAYWCQSQKTQCPLICTQFAADDSAVTRQNRCDEKTLDYSCVCGDGQTPDLALYSLTIPFFQCQTFGNQCVKACGLGNNACADKCRSDNLCGAQDPSKPNSSSSVAPQSTAPPSASATGERAAEATTALVGLDGSTVGGSSNDNNNGNGNGTGAGSSFGAAQGLVIFATCFAAGFAMLL